MKRSKNDFANQNPVCYIGTCDGGQPRVRGFLMWFADDTGFYFHTGAMKRVYSQLKDNPNVELCFFNPGGAPRAGKMLRVAGRVEFLDDVQLKTRLLEERPFLKEINPDPANPALAIFRVFTGEAYFWTMEINTREKDEEPIRF